MQQTEIITDETMRELCKHGTPDFPFAYYDENLRQFQRGCIDWHWHRELEWVFVDSGVVVCKAEGAQECLRAGDAILFSSRTIHRMESAEGAHIPNILFSPEFLAPQDSAVYRQFVAPAAGSGLRFAVFRQAEDRDRPVIRSLQEVLKAAADGNKLDIQLAALRLWRTFLQAKGQELTHCAEDRDLLIQARTRTMVQFIADHYTQKLTLEQIAGSAGVSVSAALRCFHRTMQTTPVQFLMEYRLEQARMRLLSTNDTVTRIAVECGVENISYFVRRFSARYGCTPMAYRKKKP